MSQSGIRLAVLAATFLAAPLVQAHGPVPRIVEATEIDARVLVSDSATGEVIVLDLPAGEVVTRLSTPPHVLSFGLAADGRHAFAMRGRDTDRDTVTVIDTGVADGVAIFPTIARTFTGHAPGGVRHGQLATVGGKTAVLNEEVAEIEIYGSDDFGGLDAVPTRVIKTSAPDHYHYLEAGDYLYVGHLAKGLVQIIDRASGEEAGRVGSCPILHGMAKDEASGRLFFACMQNVMVVGTRGDEMNTEVARIPYPDKQRIAIFFEGRDGVFWGSTEGANPAILRLDTTKQPYEFQAVPVNSAIQRGSTDDGEFLVLYSRTGQLEIRDGGTGDLLREVKVSESFDADYHEHVDKALLPDIVTLGHRAYVSIPPEGTLVEVDLDSGEVERTLQLGGEPTRMLIVPAGARKAALAD